jgi:predicted nucleotidyltransferase
MEREVQPVPSSERSIPDPLLQAKRREILALASRHRACNLQVFGSCARGEAHAASDVDFLVELGPGATLIDLGSLQMDLQDLLGRKVDVVEPDALHWSIRERVLREAVPL